MKKSKEKNIHFSPVSKKEVHQGSRNNTLSRRKFLGIFGALLVLGMSGVKTWFDKESGYVSGNEKEYDSEYIRSATKWLYDVYGLKIYVGPRPVDKIAGTFYDYVANNDYISSAVLSLVPIRTSDVVSKRELEKYLSLLIESPTGVTKYPSDFFRRNNIEGIRLVRNLLTDNKVLDLLRDGEDSDAAYVIGANDAVDNLITTSLGYESLDYSDEVLISNFDHEIHHKLDMKDEFLGGLNLIKYDDKSWSDLNGDIDDPYTHGARKSNFGSNVLDYRFVNSYGATSIKEDRAEYAQVIFSLKKYREFDYLTKQLENGDELDKFVALVRKAKISFLKLLYADLSGGVMNNQYWDDLFSGRLEKRRFLLANQLVKMPVKSNFVVYSN